MPDSWCASVMPVIEARLDARLAQEPLDVVLARLVDAQALDRDVAPDAAVVREHDLAHAALADHVAERVRHRSTGRIVDERRGRRRAASRGRFAGRLDRRGILGRIGGRHDFILEVN